ncbi:MAG: MFS transporter [Candidatus Hodarchaeota archaeon]
MQQKSSAKLEGNLWKIAVAEILFNSWLISAIYILFFLFLGYSFADIGLFEAITSIVIVITDLPTGALADSIGRKWAVFIANFFMLLMVLLLGFSTGGLIVIIMAGALNGLEFSFKSGANTALLYDTLKQLGKEEEFLRISGRINAAALIARLIGLITGAYLFAIDERFPYWTWAILILSSLFFLSIIQEPVKTSHKLTIKHLMEDMGDSLKFIFEKKILLWMILFFLVVDVFAESYWDVYSQAHLKSLGAEIAILGIIFAVLAGIGAIASYYADDLEKKFGEQRSLYGLIFLQSCVFILMATINNWIWLILCLILFTSIREYGFLLYDNYFNKYVPSENRASILSARSVLYNGLFGGGIIIWFFGFSIDSFGRQTTLISSGILVLLIGLFLLQIRYFSHINETSGNS